MVRNCLAAAGSVRKLESARLPTCQPEVELATVSLWIFRLIQAGNRRLPCYRARLGLRIPLGWLMLCILFSKVIR